jgi:hypothetical protein
MNLEKYFLLDIKKLGIIVLSFIGALVLHNLIYGWFKVEEPFFFILAIIVVPVYFLIAVSYTIFHHVKRYIEK